jgi:hypothetical protein
VGNIGWECGLVVGVGQQGVRRQPLLLKWKGAQTLEIVPNADIDNDVQSSSAMR